MLLGLKGERIRVHTGHGGTGVVLVGLHGVEVLTRLLLEPVLTVENKLEGVDGTVGLLGPGVTTVGHLKHGGHPKGPVGDDETTSPASASWRQPASVVTTSVEDVKFQRLARPTPNRGRRRKPAP